MKKLLYTLIILGLTITSLSCSKGARYRKQIETMHAKLPEGTKSIQLNKVSLANDTVRFFYTILADITFPSNKESSQARTVLIELVKNDDSFKKFGEDSCIFEINYQKPDGSHIDQIILTAEDLN